MGKREEVKAINWAEYYRNANSNMKYMFMSIYEAPHNKYWNSKVSYDNHNRRKFMETYQFFGRLYTATSSRDKWRAENYVLAEVLKINFGIDVIKDYEKNVSQKLAKINWAEEKANNTLLEAFEVICGDSIWDDLRDNKEYTFEHNGKSQKLSFNSKPKLSKMAFTINFLNTLLDLDIEKEAEKITKEREEKRKEEERKQKEAEQKKIEELSKHLDSPLISKAQNYLEGISKEAVLSLMIEYPQFRKPITTAIAKSMPNSKLANYLIEKLSDLTDLADYSTQRTYRITSTRTDLLLETGCPEYALIRNMNWDDLKELRKSLDSCCTELKFAQRRSSQLKQLEEIRKSEKFSIVEKDISNPDHTQFILANKDGEKFRLTIDYDDEKHLGWLPISDEKDIPAKHLRVRYEKMDGSEKYGHEASLEMKAYEKSPQALDKLFISNLKTLIRDRSHPHSYHGIPHKAIRLQSLLRTAVTSAGTPERKIRVSAKER